MSLTESGPRVTDSRVETWVLSESPRPMVAQLRDWARLAHSPDRRVVLVDVAWADVVSWPVFALVGRLAAILHAQQSALGIIVHERMLGRCEQVGLDAQVPVFSELDAGLQWAEGWLDTISPRVS